MIRALSGHVRTRGKQSRSKFRKHSDCKQQYNVKKLTLSDLGRTNGFRWRETGTLGPDSSGVKPTAEQSLNRVDGWMESPDRSTSFRGAPHKPQERNRMRGAARGCSQLHRSQDRETTQDKSGLPNSPSSEPEFPHRSQIRGEIHVGILVLGQQKADVVGRVTCNILAEGFAIGPLTTPGSLAAIVPAARGGR